MFDIGFFEICLIGIIALVVIGPEKLPRVARTTGLWLGKARGMVRTVKYEIDEQVRMEELKQSLEQAKETLKNSTSKPAKDIEASLESLHRGAEDIMATDVKNPNSEPTSK